MNEIQIKTKLVAHLLKADPDVVLGSEFRFAYGARRADLISMAGELATVYEIKSARDKVARLNYQLESYKSFFDFCFVVCEESNLSVIRGNVDASVGIVVVSDSEVRYVRQAKQYKRLDREALSSILSTAELKILTGQPDIRTKHELCQYAANYCKLKDIYNLSRKKLRLKYLPSTRLLKGEVVSLVHPDDVQTITRVAPSDLYI